jgi:hypothetical protein
MTAAADLGLASNKAKHRQRRIKRARARPNHADQGTSTASTRRRRIVVICTVLIRCRGLLPAAFLILRTYHHHSANVHVTYLHAPLTSLRLAWRTPLLHPACYSMCYVVKLRCEQWVERAQIVHTTQQRSISSPVQPGDTIST